MAENFHYMKATLEDAVMNRKKLKKAETIGKSM
jgi:hypothetical protein